MPNLPNALLLCVTLDPILRILLKLLAILPILIGNRRLDGIVRVGLDQKRLDETKHRDDLVRRFPLIWTQQTEAHGALVVVAHIRVVDLGSEADDGRLEGILVGKGNFELEVAALQKH